MTAVDFRKMAGHRHGVGIEIAGDKLSVTVVRVRPSGVRVLG